MRKLGTWVMMQIGPKQKIGQSSRCRHNPRLQNPAAARARYSRMFARCAEKKETVHHPITKKEDLLAFSEPF
jgi:hypothetical protein